MEQELLRRVQLTQLEILREVRRVCRENGISYFLCCGTFLGAVRHRGFIPWDDDLDIGMLRKDYDRFCEIAPKAFSPRFCLQSWHTEPGYALPFAKVRLRNTLYVEAKGAALSENGIYIDVFPFDYAPEDPQQQRLHARELNNLFRMKMMKSGNKPWMEKDKVNWKKRLGYFLYQLKAIRWSQEQLIKAYDDLAKSIPEGTLLCRQRGLTRLDLYEKEWYDNLTDYPFERDRFPGPRDYDRVLSAQFGDYMTLPPQEQREDRHQIIRIDFGDGTKEWNAET